MKKEFVVPQREGRQQETRFIPSNYKDNPYLNKEYIEYLERLTGTLGRAWRQGDFDIFAGQYFEEWDHGKHVIDPFPIPLDWKRLRGIDHGRNAPTAGIWGAVDYDGRIYWYREYYSHRPDLQEQGFDADVNAQNIARLSLGESYKLQVMDSACYSKTGSGETIAEIYQRNGVYSEPWPKNRIAGWNLFHEYLRIQPDEKPKMFFFKGCLNSIRTIPELQMDEKNMEDVDTSGEDHVADAIRGILESLHEAKTAKPKSAIEQKLEKLKQSTRLSPLNLNSFYNRNA